MATANINLHVFELGDFGKLRKTIPMAEKKNIALVAHDYKKDGKPFLLCERQGMRMKQLESAEFPGCSGGRGRAEEILWEEHRL